MNKNKKSVWTMIGKDIHGLEYSALSQYRFHRFWAIFWFGQMMTLPVFIFVAPKFWLAIEFFYVTEASLWANFATHFGGMSSALAAKSSEQSPDEFQG